MARQVSPPRDDAVALVIAARMVISGPAATTEEDFARETA